VGFAAIQDGLNIIYQVKEIRSYLTARLSAIGVTILLSILITLMLGSLLGVDYIGKWAEAYVHPHLIAVVLIFLAKAIGWTLVLALLLLVFAVIYYFAPNVQRTRWHWITPGANRERFASCAVGLALNAARRSLTGSSALGSAAAGSSNCTCFRWRARTLTKE
jgi:uncharacterized BrkB/YihY/UPF0761 family membrane protein